MGTMYTRKPFSSFRKPRLDAKIDPDELLREVKSPTIPPLRAASESLFEDTGEPTARWSITGLRSRASEQLTTRPFATLGAVLAVGALVGTLLGSRFARIASVVAIGALLHARRDARRTAAREERELSLN